MLSFTVQCTYIYPEHRINQFQLPEGDTSLPLADDHDEDQQQLSNETEAQASRPDIDEDTHDEYLVADLNENCTAGEK